MNGTISTLKKKLLGSSSRKSKEDVPEASDAPMNIGTPTDVKRLHHVTVDENGIQGLPPELAKMLDHMTTEEERQNPDNKAKAKNVLMWMKKEEEKKGDNFIRGDFMNFGSSGESTASNDRSSGGSNNAASSEKSTFYIESSVQKEIDQDANKLDNQKSSGATDVQQTSALATHQEDDNANRSVPKPTTAHAKALDGAKGEEGEATLR